MPNNIKGRILPSSYKMDIAEAAIWQTMGDFFELAEKLAGPVVGPSLILSRISRELRRRHGLETAQEMLRDLADAMPEVAAMDVKDKDGR